MKRRIIAVLSLVLILTSMLAMPVSAEDDSAPASTVVTPRYVNIMAFTASIDINSSGNASCYSYVSTANSNYKIYLNLSLQRYKDGNWTEVKSWEGSGTGAVSLTKSRYVTSGYYYRTAATATVYTSGGSYVESATIYSQSDYY